MVRITPRWPSRPQRQPGGRALFFCELCPDAFDDAPGQLKVPVYLRDRPRRRHVGNLYEKNIESGKVMKYYYAGDRRIAVRRSLNGVVTLNYIAGDHLGSTTTLTAENDQTVVSRSSYYPFGSLESESETPITDYRFTGQRRLASSNVYDYGARVYSATIGRFVQPDSIVPEPGNPQALNRMSYVLNNPVRYTDPTGHCVGEAPVPCPANLALPEWAAPAKPSKTYAPVPGESVVFDHFVPVHEECSHDLICGFVGGWSGGTCAPGGSRDLGSSNIISPGSWSTRGFARIPRGGAPSCTVTFESTFWVLAQARVSNYGSEIGIRVEINLCDNPESCSAPNFLREGGVELSTGVVVHGEPKLRVYDEFGRQTQVTFEKGITGYSHYEVDLRTRMAPAAIEISMVTGKTDGYLKYVHYDFQHREALLGQYQP